MDTQFLLESLKAKRLKRSRRRWRIILKLMQRKQGERMWTVCMWERIGAVRGLLST
jgi:hypothetical protein